jgi:hypothetical protein
VHGVTAEFTVEIFVGFEQRDRDTLANEKQR